MAVDIDGGPPKLPWSWPDSRMLWPAPCRAGSPAPHRLPSHPASPPRFASPGTDRRRHCRSARSGSARGRGAAPACPGRRRRQARRRAVTLRRPTGGWPGIAIVRSVLADGDLAAAGTPKVVAWPASGRPQVRDAASDAGGAPRSKRTSSRRPSRTPTISCPRRPRRPKPDRDRSLDPSVRKLIDQRRHRPVGGQPAFPDRLTELGVVADHVHGELALVRRRQRLASAGRGDRLARAVERRVQQQRLLLRVVVERRPHVGWLRLLGALRVSEDRRDRDHAAFAVAQPIGDARPLQRRPHGVACALRSRPPGTTSTCSSPLGILDGEVYTKRLGRAGPRSTG